MRGQVEELLRESKRLAAIEGPRDFILGLYAFAHRVESDPEVAEVVVRFGLDAATRLEAFERVDAQETEALVELRNGLQAWLHEVPGVADLDDSELEDPGYDSHDYWRWLNSLARFTEIAAEERPVRFPQTREERSDSTRASELMNILRGKPREAAERRDSDAEALATEDFHRRLGNLVRAHEYEFRDFLFASETLPGVAWSRIAASPPPVL